MELATYVPIGQYVQRESVVHRLDPRTKIVATTALVIVLFFVPAFAGLGSCAVAILAFLAAGRIPLLFALRSLRPVLFLLLLTVFLNMFFTGGAPSRTLFAIGPLVATEAGLHTALFIGLRLLLLVALTSLLTFTTSPVELTDGIEWLLRPLRRLGVPGHELAMMMSIALRFIPTLLEETERIMKAQMARGAEFSQGHVLARARAMIPVLVPLMLSAFRRSEDLALAMEARCYRGGRARTRMKELRWRVADGLAAVLVGAACVLFLLVR